MAVWTSSPSVNASERLSQKLKDAKQEIDLLTSKISILEASNRELVLQNKFYTTLTAKNQDVQKTAREFLSKSQQVRDLQQKITALEKKLSAKEAECGRLLEKNKIYTDHLSGNGGGVSIQTALKTVQTPTFKEVLEELFDIFTSLAATTLSKRMPFTDHFIHNGTLKESFETLVIRALQMLDDEWRKEILEKDYVVGSIQRHEANLLEIKKYESLATFANLMVVSVNLLQVVSKTHLIVRQLALNTDVLRIACLDFYEQFIINKSYVNGLMAASP
ncbi:coronin-like protein motif protein [Ranid herpesvirus 3]|uniref:Coronin-like protein motif protein n=1 Tax=Ranid herpesvirus 3 TaxID=1987509 RepID=A0A1X9T593_9VIRU|nr:coronin-like protein motif protein [Ranid herpesvirus 3]ARR28872.1 coronin-like protein motif protein [Ranid herpesvirus 3]